MLPSETDEVEVGGCGVFEGRTVPERQSWIDLQVEETDKSNEF
jgi:hypothetical protein